VHQKTKLQVHHSLRQTKCL